MGFLIKFFLFFTAAYMLMKAFAGFLSGKRNKQTPPRSQQHAAQSKQPETQEERIIEYQKKTFASSDAEDVDFVEVKDQGSRDN